MRVSDDRFNEPINIADADLFDTIDEEQGTDPDDTQPEDALERMLARIIPLFLGLFDHSIIGDTLPVGFVSHPTIVLTDRLIRLLKLEVMGDTLTETIIPCIFRRISFQSEQIFESRRLSLRGTLDPVRTIHANAQKVVTPVLLDLVGKRPTRNFNNPENMLTVLVLLQIIQDTDRFLQSPDIISLLHARERSILQSLGTRCRFVLRSHILKRFIQVTRPYQMSNQTKQIKFLVEVEERINKQKQDMEGYRMLIRWYREYLLLNLTDPGLAYQAPAGRLSSDRAYELLVLLEMLTGLGRYGYARQRSIHTGSHSQNRSADFECRFFDGDRWEIYIQTSGPLRSHRYLSKLTGIPDMVIRNPITGRIMICDAKEYTTTSFGTAFFKMMGYLYQFGYPEAFDSVAGGLLFVPRRISHQPDWTVWAGTGNRKKQAIASLTIPADGSVSENTRHAIDRCIIYIKSIL